MNNKYLLICLCLCTGTLFAQINSIERQLFELPDVLFSPNKTPYGFQEAFELRVKQPLDHKAPEKGFFYQKVYLSHRNREANTVLVSEGYQANSNRIYELSELLSANQIVVEHRFFGKSQPDSIDYQYLNLEQAAADLHRINQLFKSIYSNKWISTGISKGGQTAIFYRYFYPDDVDISIPYVAPLNLELEDKRIYAFLDTIGSDTCRNAIYAVQKKLLQSRKKVLPLVRWYAKGAGLRFNYLNLEAAFEFSILEYPFSFWQWGGDCRDIPSPDSSIEHLLEHLFEISNVDFFSDSYMQAYAAHYYQAAAQMGYYGYQIKPFRGLLQAISTENNPNAAFTPNKIKVPFDGQLSQKVALWLKTKGHRFIYINGALDTWSATAVPYSDKVDALWFNMAGKDHGAARIKNMSTAQRNQFMQQIDRWLSDSKN